MVLSELVFVFLSVHTSSRLVHAPLICCSIISPALSQNYDSKMMFTFLGCCHVDKISTLFLLSQSILTHWGRLSCWYADLVSRSSQPSSSLSYLSVYHHHHMNFSVHHHHHHHHNYPCPLCMPVTPECWSCLRSTHHHNTFNIHSTDFSTYRDYQSNSDFSIKDICKFVCSSTRHHNTFIIHSTDFSTYRHFSIKVLYIVIFFGRRKMFNGGNMCYYRINFFGLIIRSEHFLLSSSLFVWFYLNFFAQAVCHFLW